MTRPALVGKPLCHAGGGGRQGRDGRGPYPSIQQQQTPVTPTHLCTQVVGLVAGEHRVAADRAAEPACQQALQAAGCLDLWRMEHSRQAASRNGIIKDMGVLSILNRDNYEACCRRPDVAMVRTCAGVTCGSCVSGPPR